jgi:nucleoside-diphosphate-sugar epimerase
VEALKDQHDLVLSDCFDLDTPHAYRKADLRSLEQVLPLARGCDFIIHTPAWHGMHGGQKSEVDYWQLNVDGTFNVFQSALQHGVQNMVWVGSVAIAGWEREKYGFSKYMGEHLCGYYHRVHHRRIAIVRPWDFTPYGSDFLRYGLRLLTGGVDRRDVIAGTVAAMEAVLADKVECDWFELGKDHPFTNDEVERFKDDPIGVIDAHWPGYRSLMEKYKLTFPERPLVVDLAKTKEVLGFHPRYTFGTFLEELHERDAAGLPVR